MRDTTVWIFVCFSGCHWLGGSTAMLRGANGAFGDVKKYLDSKNACISEERVFAPQAPHILISATFFTATGTRVHKLTSWFTASAAKTNGQDIFLPPPLAEHHWSAHYALCTRANVLDAPETTRLHSSQVRFPIRPARCGAPEREPKYSPDYQKKGG